MLFKRKKKIAASNAEDSDLVDFFAKKTDVLLEYTESDAVKEKLNDLRFLVEHLAVSPKEKIRKIDKEISNSLDDLKLHMVKKRPEQEILDEIRDIRVLVKEREAAYFK